MDFFDELINSFIQDAKHRGVKIPPEEWEAFLSAVRSQAAAVPPVRSQERFAPVRTAEAEIPRNEPVPGPEIEPMPAALPTELPAAGGELPLDWEALRAMAQNCQRCRLGSTRQNVVFGEGAENARLMFIGEGPGAEEDATGRPFVGAAGQLLDKMIAAMHLSRSEVYIANVVKCRPPGNRMPGDDEACICLKYLEQQIKLIQPEVIVLLGGTALRFVLKTDGIMRSRGRWMDYNGIPVMPTFHPAFLLRKPEAKRDAWNDLKQVMAKLNIPL